MKQDPYLTPAAIIKAQVDQRLKCERQKGGRKKERMTELFTCFVVEFWPGGVSAWINQIPCFTISDPFLFGPLAWCLPNKSFGPSRFTGFMQ